MNIYTYVLLLTFRFGFLGFHSSIENRQPHRGQFCLFRHLYARFIKTLWYECESCIQIMSRCPSNPSKPLKVRECVNKITLCPHTTPHICRRGWGWSGGYAWTGWEQLAGGIKVQKYAHIRSICLLECTSDEEKIQFYYKYNYWY